MKKSINNLLFSRLSLNYKLYNIWPLCLRDGIPASNYPTPTWDFLTFFDFHFVLFSGGAMKPNSCWLGLRYVFKLNFQRFNYVNRSNVYKSWYRVVYTHIDSKCIYLKQKEKNKISLDLRNVWKRVFLDHVKKPTFVYSRLHPSRSESCVWLFDNQEILNSILTYSPFPKMIIS